MKILTRRNQIENPNPRFIIGPQIFNIIKGALMDPDMENIPTDYVNGTDFDQKQSKVSMQTIIPTSKWARKEITYRRAIKSS